MNELFKRVLVPLDGSEQAEAVLPLVRALAQDGTEIVLLRVVDEPGGDELSYPAAPALVSVLSPELGSELLRDAEDMRVHTTKGARFRAQGYLQRVAAKWLKNGSRNVIEVGFGAAADVILTYAGAMQADLIVMSTHGWTPMHHKGIGAVTDRVIRHAHVPVLSVRPPTQAHADEPSYCARTA